jgi:hypothetical protein
MEFLGNWTMKEMENCRFTGYCHGRVSWMDWSALNLKLISEK